MEMPTAQDELQSAATPLSEQLSAFEAALRDTYDRIHVLLFGLGESGLSLAQWLLHFGARVTVLDTRAEPPGLAELQATNPVSEQFQMLHTLPETWDYQFVSIAPGLSPMHPWVLELQQQANAHQTSLRGEVDWFVEALHILKTTLQYHPKVLAITGTNGKTTTTRLCAHLLQHVGITAYAAGNISPSLMAALHDALNTQQLPGAWVLELSSFQLHWMHALPCDAALVLNVTQDHLDWHGDMKAYALAKLRIFNDAQCQVYCRDDPNTQPNAGLSRHEDRRLCISFGSDTPVNPGAYGLVRDGGIQWLAANTQSVHDVDHAGTGRRNRKHTEPQDADAFRLLMPIDALPLRGTHNATNVMAALAMCQFVGAPMSKLLYALRSFQSEPHRTEPVLRLKDIEFIDDSKGTNVGATLAALQGFADAKVVLIAGGVGKGQDFSPLCEAVRKHARAVMLFGQDAPEIAKAIEASHIPTQIVNNMTEAVQLAYGCAKPGDVVLLSPACASFDMFQDYKHRAQVFRDAVFDLARDEGQPC